MRAWTSKARMRASMLVFCFLALGCFATPHLAHAAPTPIYECHGCDVSAMKASAYALLDSNEGVSMRATIYNLKDNRIRTFQSHWVRDSGCDRPGRCPDDRWVLWLEEVGTPSQIATAFAEIRQIYVNNNDSLTFIMEFQSGSGYVPAYESPFSSGRCTPVPGAVTAYDFMRSSAVRNDTADRVISRLGFRAKIFMNETVRLVANIVSGKFEKEPMIIHKFADGGSVTYYHNPQTDVVDWRRESLKDCENNSIPVEKKDFPGEYRFGPGNEGPGGAGGFRQWASHNDISVTPGSGGGGGGARYSIWIVCQYVSGALIRCYEERVSH